MSEFGHAESHDVQVDQSLDVNVEIAALRQAGADKFDPVRMHYLQVIASRASTHQGSVRRILDSKLKQALESFEERFAKALRDAKADIASRSTLKAGAHLTSLGDLVRYIEQHSLPNFDGAMDESVSLRRELKTTLYFRNTWSKLSVEKQVSRALEQAPKNAGPINAHMLVLRSLAQMREISPDYLNRFTSYVDTLVCLNQGVKEKQVILKNAADGQSGKKSKGRSSRSR